MWHLFRVPILLATNPGHRPPWAVEALGYVVHPVGRLQVCALVENGGQRLVLFLGLVTRHWFPVVIQFLTGPQQAACE
jgi:hypothetical protein